MDPHIRCGEFAKLAVITIGTNPVSRPRWFTNMRVNYFLTPRTGLDSRGIKLFTP